jgi:two-component system, NarL family, response regulator
MQQDVADATTIRIVIAEDHGVVADGVATMLSFESDMEVVEIVTSGEALIESVATHEPDVALVDVNLDGLDGLAAVREIESRGLATRMLALTMFTDHDTVTRAVAAGVSGYLPKNVRREELVHAVRAVAAGKGFLHPDVTRPFLERVGPLAMHAGLQPLSKREQEVLEELATGKSTREIADALGLGDETVKSHLSRIYQKLKATDRVQAVVVAMRHGLVR